MSDKSNKTSCIQIRNRFKPLKKWVQLPACIRKVCQERDTDDAPSKKGPVRVEETSGQGDETDELLKQDELAAVQAAEAEEMSDKTPNVNDSPKSAHTEIKAEVEPVPETADGLKSSSAVPEPEICVPVQAEPVADETKVTTPADEPAKVDATEPTEKPEEKPEVAKEPEVKPVEKTDDSADNVTTESAPTPEEPPVAVETVADEPAGAADEPAPVPADEPVAPTPAEPIPDQSEDSAPTEATSQPAVDEKPKQAPPAQAAQANKKKQNKKKNKKKK